MKPEEMAKKIKVLTDQKMLDRIESILCEKPLIDKISAYMKGKNFPFTSEKTIKTFFINHDSPVDEKLNFINKLCNGLISSSIPEGTHTIQGLVKDNTLTKSKLFIDFCETIGSIKDSKDKQGSTGTGAGEILLSMLVKNGKLPKTAGDINIFSQGIEVKSSNGRIAAFKKIEQSKLGEISLKYFDKKCTSKSLKQLVKYLSEQDEEKAKEFFLEFWKFRSTSKDQNKVLEKIIPELTFNAATVTKTIQTEFGKAFTELYKTNDGWKGILFFKESNNFATTDITMIYDNFSKINFSGLGMTNGNQPVYLTGTA